MATTTVRGNLEDVYESEDVPEVDKNVFAREETADPEHIELVHIDMEAAKKRYEGRVVNCHGVDFSDSIAKKRLKAYGSSAYVLEVIGKECPEKETPEQKMNRLQYELNELLEEVQGDESKNTDLVNPSFVSELLEEVKGIHVLKQSGVDKSTSKKPSNDVDSPTATTEASLLPLEQRLRRIENLVGPFNTNKQSLVDAFEDLKFRTDALNPAFVEGLETKLNQAVSKSEQLDGKREKGGADDLENNVNQVLELMKKWDAACSSLPSNVKKMQALHRLHEQAATFSERLSQLTGLRDKIEKSLSADKDVLRDLQAQTKEGFTAIFQQIDALEKRLA